MKKKKRCISLIVMFFMVFAFFTVLASAGETGQAVKEKRVEITGKIAKGYIGYIIQGKVPREVFTILNPNPEILDEFVKTGKIVPIEVRIVSGDNVEIKVIDGKEYIKKAK
jgi:hypothetical protein